MGVSQSPTATRVDGVSQGRVRALGALGGPVEGLLFDLGDVLYDATLWRRWLLRVLTQLGVHTSYRSFFHIWDHDFLDDVYRGRREFCEAFEAFLRSVGLSPGQIDEVEAACQARRSAWERNVRLLPGVRPTLAKLRAAGVPMGVLSDSEYPAAVLAERLDRLELAGTFRTVVSSLDLERIKPDPVCYRTALRAMELPADRVAFVGHDAEELAGATDVGMPTIAFNYDADAKADVFLPRFEEILPLVGPPASQPGRG